MGFNCAAGYSSIQWALFFASDAVLSLLCFSSIASWCTVGECTATCTLTERCWFGGSLLTLQVADLLRCAGLALVRNLLLWQFSEIAVRQVLACLRSLERARNSAEGWKRQCRCVFSSPMLVNKAVCSQGMLCLSSFSWSLIPAGCCKMGVYFHFWSFFITKIKKINIKAFLLCSSVVKLLNNPYIMTCVWCLTASESFGRCWM